MTLENRNCIDGRWCDSVGGQRVEIGNPADLRVVEHAYPASVAADVERAVAGAAAAFPRWAATALQDKADLLRRVIRLAEDNREAIAEVITRTNGKLCSESRAEIDAAIQEAHFQVGEGERQFGAMADARSAGVVAFTRKEPLGVTAHIIPWNFPFNIPFRKLVPALMAGNTAILKPASQTAAVGEIVVRLFQEAGLPPGVLQFVTGSGSALSQSLTADPRIRAVSFTGSTEVGRVIAAAAGRQFIRTQLEMGGKNPVLVLADADLELAADAVVTGAYSCAGQWCTATSRLIVEDRVADRLLDLLLERIGRLRLGCGMDQRASLGPVCGITQLESVLGHIESARADGAGLVTGGERCGATGLRHGCFIQPTLFDGVEADMRIASDEVFGPVLAVMRVPDYAAGLRLANAVPYGLSSSIFTADLARALDFVERSEVGLTHVNLHSAHKEPQHCFGGYKNSGFGLPEAGASGIAFFQEEKAVYIRKAVPTEPPATVHSVNQEGLVA